MAQALHSVHFGTVNHSMTVFFHLSDAIVKKSMTLFRKKMGRHCGTPIESYDVNAEHAKTVAFKEKAVNPYLV